MSREKRIDEIIEKERRRKAEIERLKGRLRELGMPEKNINNLLKREGEGVNK